MKPILPGWAIAQICEAIVVFLVVFFGEIERDVGNLVMHDRLCGNLAVRDDLSAPAEPSASFALERRPNSNLKPAGARLCNFLRNGDSIRDYDELSQ